MEPDLELPPWAARLVVVFWWLFSLATVILLPGDQSASLRDLPVPVNVLMSPLAPLVAWVLLHAARQRVRDAARRLALPGTVRFALFGAICGLVLAARSAARGEATGATGAPWGDSAFACFAVYWSVLGSWLFLRRVWIFDYHHVFWLGGLAFALVEDDGAVLRSFLRGDHLGAALLLAYTIPVHGLPFAAPFMLTPPEDLPRAHRRPGFIACLACALIPLALYTAWGLAWRYLLVG